MVLDREWVLEAEQDLISLLWPASGDTGDGDFILFLLARPDSGGVGDDGVEREFPACAAEIEKKENKVKFFVELLAKFLGLCNVARYPPVELPC